nr:hypothetical protein [Tanacetum cinerariifolium]
MVLGLCLFGETDPVARLSQQLDRLKHRLGLDTLSKVSEYLNNLKDFLDNGDSLEARNIKVEKSEKELEMFEALGHKSVVVESKKHRVVFFTKAPPRDYSKPFIRFYTPCGVDGQGAWDTELDMADSHNYMTKEMFDKLGFVRVDYGRKMVKEVFVEIHGFTFLVDFVVIGIDHKMLEEEREIDALLVELVENMEEVGSSNGELVKMGKASRNKGHNVNKLTPPPPPKIEEIPQLQSIAPQPKLDEVMMGHARLRNNEFGEEDKMRIVERGFPKKMCNLRNFVLPASVNGTVQMNALTDMGASVEHHHGQCRQYLYIVFTYVELQCHELRKLTYTSVPSLVEDYSDIGSPEVDGPLSLDYVPGPEEPKQAPLSPNYVPGPKEPEQAPLSPNYVPGPKEPEQAPLSPNYVPSPKEPEQAPLSLNYVPGPKEPEQAPPSPVYLPYVPKLVYPEYMPPKDDIFPAEEKPLPVAATPTADSPGYIPEFDPNRDPEEDEEEDPEGDPSDYPADSTVVALPAVDHVPSEEEVEESSAADAARQNEPAIAMDDPYSLVREELFGFVDRVDVAPKHPMSRELDYGITDTWDELVGVNEEIAPTTLQGVNQRVTDLSTIVEQETNIMYSMMEEAQDDRSQLRGRVNLLYRDRPVHRRLAVMIEREARMAREAWGLSMDASDNARSNVMSVRTTLVAQHAMILELQAADHRR